MERAEFVRYAPGSDTADARKELLDIAASAINSIEQSFGKRGKNETITMDFYLSV